MPKSSTMDLRCVLALVAALAVAAMCCSPAGTPIVGGDTVSLDQHPYQVALSPRRPPRGRRRRAVLRRVGPRRSRAHHHRRALRLRQPGEAPSGQPMTPARHRRSRRHRRASATSGPPAQRVHVQRISSTRRFDRGSANTTRPCSPRPRPCSCRRRSSRSRWSSTRAGPPPRRGLRVVTGWGSTAPSSGPVISLRGVQVKAVSDTTCNADYQNNTRRSRSTARSRPARAHHQQRQGRLPG